MLWYVDNLLMLGYCIYMGKKYLLYIHHEQFEAEKGKSALVNLLLEQHYATNVYTSKPLIAKNVYTNKTAGAGNVYTKPIIKTAADVSKVIDNWKPCKHGAEPKLCRHARAGKACK